MNKSDVKILIIDDEEMIVDEFLFFLDQFGYNVKGYSDSEKAAEILKKEKFDIVITDLKMPNVSGMEIAKIVNETNPETITFIITGFATIDSVIEAIQYGVYDYIRKPFKFKEIKINIERAVEKIVLTRTNKILNEKIQQMLSYITTLYDISSILYQLSDFSMVMDMIIDTVTEGLNIPVSALYVLNENNNEYEIKKHHGLSDKFAKQYRLTETSTINNLGIATSKPTIFSGLNNGFILDGQQVEGVENLDVMILIPIKYQNKIYGYLSVFDSKEEYFSLDEELKLLQIIATQAAPIFQQHYEINEDDTGKIKKLDSIVKNIIEKNIQIAQKVNGTVSFVQIRLENLNQSDNIVSYSSIKKKLEKIIINEFNQDIEIIWQFYDTLLLIVPEGDPVSTDLSITHIRTKLEELHTFKDGKPEYSLYYSSLSYPMEYKSPAEYIKLLSEKLLYSKEDSVN